MRWQKIWSNKSIFQGKNSPSNKLIVQFLRKYRICMKFYSCLNWRAKLINLFKMMIHYLCLEIQFQNWILSCNGYLKRYKLWPHLFVTANNFLISYKQVYKKKFKLSNFSYRRKNPSLKTSRKSMESKLRSSRMNGSKLWPRLIW